MKEHCKLPEKKTGEEHVERVVETAYLCSP